MPVARILVVEDSPTNLQVIRNALQAHGYEIITAADGEEAVAKAVAEDPQLVILDVILPKKNGFQVCRQLRSIPETKHLRILMLTSKSQASDRFWGLKQGADRYLTKPFNQTELITQVNQLL